MKKIKTLERRIEKIKENLMSLGDIHPGSLSKQYNICGQPNCRCKDKTNPKKHGPYYQLSYVVNKKSTSRFIQKEFISDVRKQIANYKKFKKLVEEWKTVGAELAKLKIEAAKKFKN